MAGHGAAHGTENKGVALLIAVLALFLAIAETGASGPSGNSYGDAAGHSCIAVSGPVSLVRTIETGHGDRVANMRSFAAALLALLDEALDGASPQP
jgi:nicotinamide mononucleotide (NMN) deamidase PncC